MHLVNRGVEPTGLAPIRARYTQAWIDHYRNGVGRRPTDKRWVDFVNDLGVRFGGCCGYCEGMCKGVVDHYRPKSRFPRLVYSWDNWIFSCHDCNQSKGSQWPRSGFTDPCSPVSFCTAPSCFAFDLKTGEVLPNPNLSARHRLRAKVKINALGLNLSFHLRSRLAHINHLDALVLLAKHDAREAANRLARLILPDAPFYSLTRFYIDQQLP